MDNLKLPQSLAIARYLAREHNLVGKSNLDAAKADAVVDTCIDLMTSLYNQVYLVSDAKDKVSWYLFLYFIWNVNINLLFDTTLGSSFEEFSLGGLLEGLGKDWNLSRLIWIARSLSWKGSNLGWFVYPWVYQPDHEIFKWLSRWQVCEAGSGSRECREEREDCQVSQKQAGHSVLSKEAIFFYLTIDICLLCFSFWLLVCWRKNWII